MNMKQENIRCRWQAESWNKDGAAWWPYFNELSAKEVVLKSFANEVYSVINENYCFCQRFRLFLWLQFAVSSTRTQQTECTSNDGWHRLQLPPLCMLPINSILGLCVALWNIPILIGDFMYLFTSWVCRSILSLLNCSKKANKSVKENTHIAYDRYEMNSGNARFSDALIQVDLPYLFE